MTEYHGANIRISDTEREDALQKLGEHMSSGRLDLEEFGERSAKVAATKTRGDLLELFIDLPEPRPVFGQPVPKGSSAVEPRRSPTLTERVTPVVVPIVGAIVIIGLFVVLKGMAFIALPFVIMALSGGLGGRGRGGPASRAFGGHGRRHH